MVISDCLSVYSAERYLVEAAESFLDRTFTDFQFLIPDDGSTDGSLAISKQHEAWDPRIRPDSGPNKGRIATRNELIELSRGLKFFLFYESAAEIRDSLSLKFTPLSGVHFLGNERGD